jgi:hypothetical protein
MGNFESRPWVALLAAKATGTEQLNNFWWIVQRPKFAKCEEHYEKGRENFQQLQWQCTTVSV